MIPQTYAQWRHCITIECGLPLTRAYVTERLAILRNERHEDTTRFALLYGQAHLQRVRAWFAQALAEIDAGPVPGRGFTSQSEG